MGNGIAHVFARGGFNVVLCDVEQKFLDRGLGTISKNLDREVAKAKIRLGIKIRPWHAFTRSPTAANSRIAIS